MPGQGLRVDCPENISTNTVHTCTVKLKSCTTLHTHNALNNRRNSSAMTLKTYFKLGLAALLTLLVSESDSAMAQSNQAPERVYQSINATDEPVRLTHGWVHTPKSVDRLSNACSHRKDDPPSTLTYRYILAATKLIRWRLGLQ